MYKEKLEKSFQLILFSFFSLKNLLIWVLNHQKVFYSMDHQVPEKHYVHEQLLIGKICDMRLSFLYTGQTDGLQDFRPWPKVMTDIGPGPKSHRNFGPSSPH
jgi:hypothetical protein